MALPAVRTGSLRLKWSKLDAGSPWEPESADKTLMAKQQGWIRKRKYADGMTWLFCYLVTRPSDGKRVENSQRVGRLADFPTERSAWMEVARLGLEKYIDCPIGLEPTFQQLAEDWRLRELRKEGIIGKKAGETADRDEHNLDQYVIPRWGRCLTSSIRPTDVEAWFEVLALTPQGKREKAAQVAHHRQNQFSHESSFCPRSTTRVDFFSDGLQPIPFTEVWRSTV